MSMIENIWLIGLSPRNQENIINDHKSQISILGKLSISDVISSRPSVVQFPLSIVLGWVWGQQASL